MVLNCLNAFTIIQYCNLYSRNYRIGLFSICEFDPIIGHYNHDKDKKIAVMQFYSRLTIFSKVDRIVNITEMKIVSSYRRTLCAISRVVPFKFEFGSNTQSIQNNPISIPSNFKRPTTAL